MMSKTATLPANQPTTENAVVGPQDRALDDNELAAVVGGGRINVVPIKDITWPAPIYWPQYDG
jgi:hypothetical protein